MVKHKTNKVPNDYFHVQRKTTTNFNAKLLPTALSAAVVVVRVVVVVGNAP
ncbi:ilvB operon leader peptide IvbL [Escherichia coli]|nr:ilvB operon leader peptide IvbL [Escherichia coli]